jgi:hypothetical protein
VAAPWVGLTLESMSSESVAVSLSGPATARHVDKVIPVFRDAIATKKQIMIDFSDTRANDARFRGLHPHVKEKTQRQWSKPDFHRPVPCIGKNISP